MDRLPKLIADLYNIVDELSAMFPGQKFTPDGHLIGSIGEAVAKEIYGLTLVPASTKNFDATLGNQNVQVKMTAGKRVSVSDTNEYAHLLIVLHLDRKRGFTEVFAGGFPVQFLQTKTRTSRGYRLCSTKELQELNVHTVDEAVSGSMKLLNSKFLEEKR